MNDGFGKRLGSRELRKLTMVAFVLTLSSGCAPTLNASRSAEFDTPRQMIIGMYGHGRSRVDRWVGKARDGDRPQFVTEKGDVIYSVLGGNQDYLSAPKRSLEQYCSSTGGALVQTAVLDNAMTERYRARISIDDSTHLVEPETYQIIKNKAGHILDWGNRDGWLGEFECRTEENTAVWGAAVVLVDVDPGPSGTVKDLKYRFLLSASD